MDRAQHLGVEAHPRHQQEGPLARATDRHAPDRAARDDAGREVQATGQSQLSGQDVGRPAGPHCQRGGRADQRLDGLVGRPVAAVDDGVKPIALPTCARIVDEERGARHGPR